MAKFTEERPDEVRKRFPNTDARGREILDPTPVAPPVGYNRPPSLWDQMREAIRAEKRAAEDMEDESFEEADDFDIGDDFDPDSPYEVDYAGPGVAEVIRRAQEDIARAEAEKAERAEFEEFKKGKPKKPDTPPDAQKT